MCIRDRGKTFGQVFKTDFSGVGILNFFAVMFSFLFVDLFDTCLLYTSRCV